LKLQAWQRDYFWATSLYKPANSSRWGTLHQPCIIQSLTLSIPGRFQYAVLSRVVFWLSVRRWRWNDRTRDCRIQGSDRWSHSIQDSRDRSISVSNRHASSRWKGNVIGTKHFISWMYYSSILWIAKFKEQAAIKPFGLSIPLYCVLSPAREHPPPAVQSSPKDTLSHYCKPPYLGPLGFGPLGSPPPAPGGTLLPKPPPCCPPGPYPASPPVLPYPIPPPPGA
jgi:hypothetical protein